MFSCKTFSGLQLIFIVLADITVGSIKILSAVYLVLSKFLMIFVYGSACYGYNNCCVCLVCSEDLFLLS